MHDSGTSLTSNMSYSRRGGKQITEKDRDELDV